MSYPYDPTQPATPFSVSTDVAKCYANYPLNVHAGLTGHRLTQNLGHNLQVTTDDSQTGTSYTYMLKHPQ